MFIHVGVLRVNWTRSESAITDVERHLFFRLDRLVVVMEPLDKKMHD